jgi:hypothetical protein
MKLVELFESVSDHEDWRKFQQLKWNPYGVQSAGGRMAALLYKEIGDVPINNTAKVNEAGGVGKIVPGVNTTPDVGPNQTEIEAAKFFAKAGVDPTGKPRLKRSPKVK